MHRADGVSNTLNILHLFIVWHTIMFCRQSVGVQRPEPSVTSDETNYCDPPVEDNQSNVRLEPVVRLEDVTRLLQHSSIRISVSWNATSMI